MSTSLVTKAKKLEAALDIKPRQYKSKTYKDCFVGSDCVEAIITLKLAHNEQQAVEFGNKLIQVGIIRHVERHHSFKNEEHLYRFNPGYDGPVSDSKPIRESLSTRSSVSTVRSDSVSLNRSPRSKHPSRGRGHKNPSSNLTLTSVRDILSRHSYIRRKDVYFRVNKYMRQNRINDARVFLRDVLKYIATKNKIEWSVLYGPTQNNVDMNHITDATKEKYLQDVMGESSACWMDITLLESKLFLFYDTQGTDDKVRECIHKLQSILNALQRSLDQNASLKIQSYYYRFIECDTRACLAYSVVKVNPIGYAAHAGIALEHCRKAMELNAFHALSHGMYGYLLDRCLDKFEESRQYLEYAIHLNNYYDSVNVDQDADAKTSDEDTEKKKKDKSYHRFAYIHIWLATLLVNFEDEFREKEYELEIKLRQEYKQRYNEALKKYKGRSRQGTLEDESDPSMERQSTEESIVHVSPDSYGPLASPELPSFGKVDSIHLVKQLSNAHAYRRQRESIKQRVWSPLPPADKPTMGVEISVDSVTEAESPGSIRNQPSLSYGYPSLPPGLTDEQSIVPNVEQMVAERLVDDTLTQRIGNQFGIEFMKQMTAITDDPEKHFKLALKLEPQNSRFHSVYGVFLIQQEKFKDARAHFEKAIKYDPNNVVSLNNLGWILTLSGFSHYQQARNYLMKAAKLQDNCAAIQFNLARLLAHAFGDDEEHITDAKRYYLAALMNDRNNSHIHYFYGVFLKFVVRDNESARQSFQQAKDLLSSSIAVNTGEQSTTMSFEVNGYIEHAKILKEQSKFEAARFLLKRAARLDMSKKREIKELLQEIQEEQNELTLLSSSFRSRSNDD